MKAVLMSIQPKWCELIASGKKTVEVRKTKPKLDVPFKVYIYCTKGKPILGRSLKDDSLKETPESDFDNYNRDTLFRANGKVIGEFVCDRVYDLKYLPKEYSGKPAGIYEQFICENSCLSFDDIKAYGKGTSIYGWHITDLVVYDEPRELRDFQLPCDHENDCGTCKRAIYCSSTRRFCRCDLEDGLKRPPQSWCYVEEVNDG